MFPYKSISIPDTPSDIEPIWLKTSEGRTEMWFLPGYGVSKANPGPTVIFAHGNAELIDHWNISLSPYRTFGINVVLCEYRGYGRSDGSPSQKHITEDYIQCYDYIYNLPEVDKNKIFFHGRSIGGGVVCSLAKERIPAALILQSAYLSTFDFIKEKFALISTSMIQDPFDNESVIEAYKGPVLIIHGRADRLIPLTHAEKLHELSPESKLKIFECGHNDFPVWSGEFWSAIRGFLVVIF